MNIKKICLASLAGAFLIFHFCNNKKIGAAPWPGSSQYQRFQSYGAISTGSMVTVNISTVPTMLLSTGSFIFDPYYDIVYPEIPYDTDRSTVGLFMPQRNWVEIQNQSHQSIWIGFDASVSSWINPLNVNKKLGRVIPSSGSWVIQDSWSPFWGVAASSTGWMINIIQEK